MKESTRKKYLRLQNKIYKSIQVRDEAESMFYDLKYGKDETETILSKEWLELCEATGICKDSDFDDWCC